MTHREGGYIWSPKANANGARNQTYENLTLTQAGDIVFSYAYGQIKAIGTVSASCSEQAKPSEFGLSGENWSSIGWSVPIDWQLLSTPIKPKDYLDDIQPMLPDKHSPLQSNGNGNQGCYLAAIDPKLGKYLIHIIKPGNLEEVAETTELIIEQEELRALDDLQNSNIDSTEKLQLSKARVGQGKFRKNVESIETCCRVTGTKDKTMLIASHMKPWRLADNFERLDGSNGLLLSPHIDKLFDKGWISFSDDGELLCATDRAFSLLTQWGVNLPLNVGDFTLEQKRYLNFHRKNVFSPT